MVLISDIPVPGFDKSLCFGLGLGERTSCGKGLSGNYTEKLTLSQSKDKGLVNILLPIQTSQTSWCSVTVAGTVLRIKLYHTIPVLGVFITTPLHTAISKFSNSSTSNPYTNYNV